MVSVRAVLTGCCLCLAACGNYPRDVEHTYERIEATKTVRVGMIAGLPDVDRERAGVFLAQLGRVTGARQQISSADGETLLLALDAGKLDLVVGDFAEDTPWTTEATLVGPLQERTVDGKKIGLNLVARNGENRWIMLLEGQVRDLEGRQ